ncbi:MAG: ATP-grasp domain-containing protein [Alphaproteobacteria bacterium]|jgi:biotin carboxylase
MTAGRGPPLLLVDPGPARKRWLMERFLAQPVDLFVLVDTADDWVVPMLPPDRVLRMPLATTPRAEAVEALLEEKGITIAGLGTYHEPSVTLAAELAERRGLPGPTLAAARRSSSSKLAMRAALASGGVPNPRFAAAADPRALAAAVAAIGYPCVVKPASGADSAGVRKLLGPSDLAAAQLHATALDEARRASGEAIVDLRWMAEEYLSGPLVAVDGIVRNGEVSIFGVTETALGPEPWFNIEANWIPPRLNAASIAALEMAAAAAVRALGFVTCGFHAELRDTPQGPRLIEIAARIAGGAMPKGYLHAQGLDLAAAMTTLWLGGVPDLCPRHSRFVLQEGVFPRTAGTVRTVTGVAQARAVCGLFEFALITQPGEPARVYPDASQPIYYFGIDADDRETLERRRVKVRGAIKWSLG